MSETTVCPDCGAVRPASPSGLTAPTGMTSLPTFGTALKRARGERSEDHGGGRTCACGRRRLEDPRPGDASEGGPAR